MNSNRQRPLIFGEVLFDCFPDGSRVLGGAPFNVAWNLKGFGLDPLFVSRVGPDSDGRRVISSMKSHGMDLRGMQLDPKHPTGNVEVTFVDGEPTYEIAKDRAYDFIDTAQIPPLADIGLLYHGTLATRNPVSSETLNHLFEETSAPAFVDINLRRPWYERDRVLRSVKTAHWCKLNEHELAELSPVTSGRGENNIVHGFVGSGLETLFVTRGAQGAAAISGKGENCSVVPTSEVEVVDTVGAGDAFCSVLILGVMLDWDLQIILDRAQDFASNVVGIRGAVTTDAHFYERFRTAWRI